MLRRIFVGLFLFLLLSSGCSEDGAEPVTDGPIPTIRDLTIVSHTEDSAILRWTAPGEANTQAAAEYDLRFLADPLIDANWDEAIEATTEPAPSSPGLIDSAEVLGLDAGGDARARLCAEFESEVAGARLPEVVPLLADGLSDLAPGESLACVPSRHDLRPPVSTLLLPVAEPDGALSSVLVPIGLVLAVFAKSSPKVFLARKAPVLSRLVSGRTLVLALPETWRLP